MNGLNMGIIICGYRFSDMMYSEIYEYMPKEFQMLLIASQRVSWKKCGYTDVIIHATKSA